MKTAMQPYGYDVQICYSCAGMDAPRFMASKSIQPQGPTTLRLNRPASPRAPVDFGVTTHQFPRWAYDGTHYYEGEGPRKNLRVIAALQNPWYLVAAATKESGITDLHQIAGKPIRLLNDPYQFTSDVLNYYGVSGESIKAAGGKVANGMLPDARHDFDVVVFLGTLNNTPEFSVLYEITQKYDLTFLQLDDKLLDKMVADHNMERRDVPEGFFAASTDRSQRWVLISK